MPFKSEKQRKYLFAKKPDVAKTFVKHEKMSEGGVVEEPKEETLIDKLRKYLSSKNSNITSDYDQAMQAAGIDANADTEPKKKEEPAQGYTDGGMIPGNDEKNDVVEIDASPAEVVISREDVPRMLKYFRTNQAPKELSHIEQSLKDAEKMLKDEESC